MTTLMFFFTALNLWQLQLLNETYSTKSRKKRDFHFLEKNQIKQETRKINNLNKKYHTAY